jgi:hypothetical protein
MRRTAPSASSGCHSVAPAVAPSSTVRLQYVPNRRWAAAEPYTGCRRSSHVGMSEVTRKR